MTAKLKKRLINAMDTLDFEEDYYTAMEKERSAVWQTYFEYCAEMKRPRPTQVELNIAETKALMQEKPGTFRSRWVDQLLKLWKRSVK